MKLTSDQVKEIIVMLTPYIKDQHAKLYSYTRLIDNDSKNSNVDLLLLTESDTFAQILKIKVPDITHSVQNVISEAKIDLRVYSKSETEQDIYLKMILPESLVLYSW